MKELSTDALVSSLTARLESDIVSGALPVGTWLRQDKLAIQLGASRTPVREAIQALHERGLVELLPNRGARVRQSSAREIQEMYVVRAELEGLAARLAADLATQAQLDALGETVESFRAAVSLVEQKAEDGHAQWSAANDAFHEIVLEASCNTRLRDTVRALHRTNARNLTWQVLEDDLRLLRSNVDQHEAVRAAIEAGDGEAARAAMIAHVRRSGDLITARAQL